MDYKKQLKMIKQDVLSALLAFTVAGFLWFSLGDIPKRMDVGLTSDFMPRLIAVCLIIFGVILLSITLLKYLKMERPQSAAAEVKQAKMPLTFERILNEYADLLSIVLLLFYVFSMSFLGYIVASVSYIAFQMLLLSVKGNRKKLSMALVTIISPPLVYFIFTRGLSLMLPRGLFYF